MPVEIGQGVVANIAPVLERVFTQTTRQDGNRWSWGLPVLTETFGFLQCFTDLASARHGDVQFVHRSGHRNI